MSQLHTAMHIALVGIGATVIMDLWLALQRRLGMTTLPNAMIGRWIGHWRHGQFRHVAIAKATPIAAEAVWGTLAHYLVGIGFAILLRLATGRSWFAQPTLWPALVFGIASVVAPLCIMQPAFGAGWFAMNTPTPRSNCLRSLATHSVFGCGMYLSATALAALAL